MLDEETCTYYGDNITVKFSPMSTKLLSYIIINKHRIVTFEELTKYLWNEKRSWRADNRLRNLIHKINVKIESEFHIVSKKRAGYKIGA